MKRFGKADATRTQSVAKGLSFRAYAIAYPKPLPNILLSSNKNCYNFGVAESRNECAIIWF
ncbi:MAG: hypothetical protein F6K55_35270 [Moorea sp. SIO4A3]|nr:hypothetical protein [Moorena sp. SIO4A3]